MSRSRSLPSPLGWQAWRILQMCWVSSRETSNRSPSIISSSSCFLAVSESSKTGASRPDLATNGDFLWCFLGEASIEIEISTVSIST